MGPTFSVITVCFNSQKTIRQTIQSVLSQKYKNYEYILIDGGSSDNTVKIISEYKSPKIKMISEKDKGLYDAMNKGIKLSKGKFICILNSDDHYVNENVLFNVQKSLEDRTDIALSDISFFKSTGNKLVNTRKVKSSWFHPKKLKWGWMPPHPGMFIKKDIFKEYGNYSLDYQIAADFEFVVRIFNDNKLKYIHLNFISVNMSEGGLSTKGINSNLKITSEMYKACKQNNIKTNYLMLLSRLPAKLILMLMIK